MSIPFIDLKAQQAHIADRIDKAVKRVLSHGQYILGPEVKQLENNLGKFCGAEHTISCANGTDALTLCLMAENIGPSDVVFVPSFTFCATAEVVMQLGATAIFVDVDPQTFNISPESLKAAIKKAHQRNLTLRAIIAVDIFGAPADYAELREIARQHDLVLISDAAQSFGCLYRGKRTGDVADYTTTSFFPAKPLGCYGDGGCIFVNDIQKADLLKSLRFHGKGSEKYDNVRIGLNSRLDTIQAAILLEKLAIFEEELAKRDAIAQIYTDAISEISSFRLQKVLDNCQSSWAQYTLISNNRDDWLQILKAQGIPAQIYYPRPLHLQTGYKHMPQLVNLEISEQLAKSVFSIPMSAYLQPDHQNIIIECLRQYKNSGEK